MKKQVLNIFAVLAVIATITSCKKNKEAETSVAKAVENVTAEATYKVIPTDSKITWQANKIVGGHNGTISVSNGFAKVKGNQLVGGNFIFDVKNTLTCTDVKDEEGNTKIVTHLKSADFFNVKKHPNATFTITSVEGNNVSGNLTLKGIKKNVTFPANVTFNNDVMTISSAVFTIDRTEWDIKYNSGKFGDPAKLGDYMIKDDVELKINVKATKA